LIWDSDDEPPAGDWLYVLWRSYGTKGDKNIVSIPRLVEENAESLRARYLQWIYDLGEMKVNDKRIIDHLEIRPSLSYWWMTLLAQKCTYAASPNIYHAIRLLAFEDLCNSTNVQNIKVVTPHRELATEIHCWCSAKKLHCEITLLKTCYPKTVDWCAMLNRFSKTLTGFYLIVLYFIKRLTLRREDVPPQVAFKKGIMFFDILTHFNKSAVTAGRFDSAYWTKLPSLIQELGLNANWAHFFYKHYETPNVTEASGVIEELNKDSMGKHFLIDENFNLRCLARTIFDFCRLIWKGLSIREFPICFPQNSRFSFHHILRNDWRMSLFGKPAASALCQLNSLESYLSSVPKQRMGIYIQENQPWEIALLYAWRSNKHGTIIGTPHTTIRFWDLRYFYDARTFENKDKNALPIPDKVALNGPAALGAFATGLGPVDRLIEVEALRFVHTKQPESTDKKANKICSNKSSKLVLLVATDLLDSNTQIQLEWVAEVMKSGPNDLEVIIRPHPSSDFSSRRYSQWMGSVLRTDLSQLLERADVVFCSNASSIAVDGHLAGKKILIMLNGKTLNFSPLRGLKGFTNVTSLEELRAGLFASPLNKTKSRIKYFCFSKELEQWKTLLLEHSLLA